ncbi:MAG: IS1634 family transposase [Peptococcaceae bacterium]|nr:IS1634 family transposase [Peptococcaceae bacterium]
MFIKRSWNPRLKNPKIHKQLVESYWDPDAKVSRHRTIANITDWPDHVVEALELALKNKTLIDVEGISFTTGDPYRGAGSLAIYHLWKKWNMDHALGSLSEATRQSIFLMVVQRILDPGSKLALQRSLDDTIFSRVFSRNRFDEDSLYETMDELHKVFYEVQEKLMENRSAPPTLLLYDITSSYFEGTHADDAKYGYSRDKRWDRYQIVIGLVCDENGIPLAVEVWPGDTVDKTTVVEQVNALKMRFGIEEAIFVGDKGMYSSTNIEALSENGFKYILGLDWREQREQLIARSPQQLELFDKIGVIEWEDNGTRYIGCASELRRERDAARRQNAMEEVEKELRRLQETCRKGAYYSHVRLHAKIEKLLKDHHVKRLWNIRIVPLEEGKSPEQKARFELQFSPCQEEIARQELLDGKYVLETTVSSQQMSPGEVERSYKLLKHAERGFRHIKSFLEIRPMYHHLRRRIRAHVLICFLAYYLVKQCELEFRAQGETREVEEILRRWDKLRLTHQTLRAEGYESANWNWQLGELGVSIKNEVSKLGLWRAVEKCRHSLLANVS